MNSPKPIIEVKNIGKKYNINHQKGGYLTLRDVLTNIFKNPFSFLLNKAKTSMGIKTKEEFWALKNISFDIHAGQVVGIIGSNGAGKSTLLKILTGITPPTEGEIILNGKIGSLLEVGTGFHPELTGRENIFLNGAILGMTHREIVKKFDEIIEFSGIGKFLDTPVKYYSSGMYVRLAFSVAAHMEPDILLVDEVLAVGDAEFQKKCLGKMEEVTQKSKRTILFVSHNMSAIQNICKYSILLDKGTIVMMGETPDVINKYLLSNLSKDSTYEFPIDNNKPASITKISLLSKENQEIREFPINHEFKIKIDFECHTPVVNSVMSILIYSHDRDLLLYSSDSDTTGKLSEYKTGKYSTEITIPKSLLNIGQYFFEVRLHNPNIFLYATAENMGFEIKNIENKRSIVFRNNHMGRISVPLYYETKKKN